MESLIKRLQERDEQALREAMEVYIDDVYALIAKIARYDGAAADIEEATSDVFLYAWNEIARFDETRGTFKTWLYTIAKYKALTLKRAARPTAPLEDTFISAVQVEEEVLVREQLRQVKAELQQWQVRDRHLFARRYFFDEPIQQIATTLHMTRQACDTKLSRLRQKLKRQFTKGGRPL